MATDATGTPTSLGIPTYTVGVDRPTGNGENEAYAVIDGLFVARSLLTVIGSSTATQTTGSANSFAAGLDVVSSPLSFTAVNGAVYRVTALISGWGASGGTTAHLNLNLDGADAGKMYEGVLPASSSVYSITKVATLLSPSAGTHTVNVRAFSQSGALSLNPGAGGAGNNMPNFVTLERLQ